MFLFISFYEWLSLKANNMLLLTVSATTLVIWFALWDGHKRTSRQQRTILAIEQQQQNDYKKYQHQLQLANPGTHMDGGHMGTPVNPFYFGNRMGAKYAVMPPAPLSIISTGHSDLLPYYYKVNLSKKQALYHSEELENPQTLFHGHFDLSFVVIYLLPLIIIAFSYNIYAADKANGTLPLLMAQHIALQKITAYRFLFRYLLFSSFTTIVLLIGLSVFGINISETATLLWQMIGLIWMYIAFWFSLSFLITSYKKNAGFNATVLVACWLTMVLILPILVSTTINHLHPMPSRMELITQTREINDAVTKNNNALNRFLEEHPDFKPPVGTNSDRNSTSLRNRIEVEMQKEKLLNRFTTMANKRAAIINNYRFVSPAIYMQELFNHMAGTHEDAYTDFDKQVKAYHEMFRNYFEPLVYRQQKLTASHIEHVPAFHYKKSVSHRHAGILKDVSFMIVVTIVLSLWGFTDKKLDE
jgi:ABC-2 type transport system permease protein